jgi:hypothetical protein
MGDSQHLVTKSNRSDTFVHRNSVAGLNESKRQALGWSFLHDHRGPKSCPCWESNPRCPACSPPAILFAGVVPGQTILSSTLAVRRISQQRSKYWKINIQPRNCKWNKTHRKWVLKEKCFVVEACSCLVLDGYDSVDESQANIHTEATAHTL